MIAGEAPLPVVEWGRVAAALDARRAVSLSALHRPSAGESVELGFGPVESFAGQMDVLVQRVRQWTGEGRRVVVASRQGYRMAELLAERGVRGETPIPAALADDVRDLPERGRTVVVPHPLTSGFALDDLLVVTDGEILGWHRRAKKLRWLRDSARLASWTELAPGDLVVHVHHGIGLYRGLERLAFGDGERDYLHLEYAQGDALYVPTDQLRLVEKYIGGDRAPRSRRPATGPPARAGRLARKAGSQSRRASLLPRPYFDYRHGSDADWKRKSA
jgi:transcription-repair coupling factor (superfamily II helicase)